LTEPVRNKNSKELPSNSLTAGETESAAESERKRPTQYHNIVSLCMIPAGNVVFVAFSFPPNRRFYKEIIFVSSEIVLRGIKRYWRAQPRGDGDEDRDEKIEKKQI